MHHSSGGGGRGCFLAHLGRKKSLCSTYSGREDKLFSGLTWEGKLFSGKGYLCGTHREGVNGCCLDSQGRGRGNCVALAGEGEMRAQEHLNSLSRGRGSFSGTHRAQIEAFFWTHLEKGRGKGSETHTTASYRVTTPKYTNNSITLDQFILCLTCSTYSSS